MTVKKQLLYGMIFVSILIVLPIQIHSMYNDYKHFRIALGTAEHFQSDTSNIIKRHQEHILCSRYIKQNEE